MSFSLRQLFIFVTVFAVLTGVVASWVAEINLERRYRLIFAMRVEALMLEHAVQSYRKEVGTLPPSSDTSEIQSHFADYYDGITINELFASQRDLKDIDARELLFLWLHEIPEATNARIKTPGRSRFFAFERDRLVDVDKDGWLEYISDVDTCFQYSQGRIDVLNPLTGQLLDLGY